MLKDIYIFANSGNLKETPKSGGQTSARRVMKGLESLGYEIHPIKKHRSEWKGKWAHVIEILLFALYDVIKIFCRLVFKRRKGAVFMMLTYAGSLVPLEFIITIMVKCLGFKSTYYLKGGKLIDTYPSGGRIHKWMFKKIMDWQELVFFEGMECLHIVQNISSTQLVYFPNYIADGKLGMFEGKQKQPFGIIYFGRVAPAKNVHIIIEAYQLLCEKYPDLRLTIIGGSTRDVAYAKQIEKMIAESPYHDRIQKLGNSPFEVLLKEMKTHHFFIFPSREEAEGQSNSLTEAMSQGLIPIVSNWHFNKTIVGNDDFVIEGYNPKDYADAVDRIISSGNMDKYMYEVQKRIRDYYTESIVLHNINDALKQVLSPQH